MASWHFSRGMSLLLYGLCLCNIQWRTQDFPKRGGAVKNYFCMGPKFKLNLVFLCLSINPPLIISTLYSWYQIFCLSSWSGQILNSRTRIRLREAFIYRNHLWLPSTSCKERRVCISAAICIYCAIDFFINSNALDPNLLLCCNYCTNKN